MKTYRVIFQVDEEQLDAMYREAADLAPDEPSPSTIEMLESEAQWLLQSGCAVISIEQIEGDLE